MRKTILLALFIGFGSALATAQGSAPANVRIEDLSWLAGSWSGEVRGAAPGTRFETHYTTPQGGVILSSSKAFNPEGKLSWFEFERFEMRDGVLQVIPYPNGKPSVAFTLTEYDPVAKKAVFSNPQHDDPNRITYQRLTEDRLQLTVTGDKEGESMLEITLSRLP